MADNKLQSLIEVFKERFLEFPKMTNKFPLFLIML
jgi:hypothetical protein